MVMKTAGVVVENWKVQTFRTYLERASYTFDEVAGPVADTTMLRVRFEAGAEAALASVVESAQEECRRHGKPSPTKH